MGENHAKEVIEFLNGTIVLAIGIVLFLIYIPTVPEDDDEK